MKKIPRDALNPKPQFVPDEVESEVLRKALLRGAKVINPPRVNADSSETSLSSRVAKLEAAVVLLFQEMKKGKL